MLTWQTNRPAWPPLCRLPPATCAQRAASPHLQACCATRWATPIRSRCRQPIASSACWRRRLRWERSSGVRNLSLVRHAGADAGPRSSFGFPPGVLVAHLSLPYPSLASSPALPLPCLGRRWPGWSPGRSPATCLPRRPSRRLSGRWNRWAGSRPAACRGAALGGRASSWHAGSLRVCSRLHPGALCCRLPP